MKKSIRELALLGGDPEFSSIRPLSNILSPNVDNYLRYTDSIFSSNRTSDNGPLVMELEERLSKLHQTEYCVSFCSGFMALQTAVATCALPGKSEVIFPSLTYRRMADIVSWAGFTPHFCDVDRESLGMSAVVAAEAINDRTALILGVHPITNLCDIDGLQSLSAETDIPLIFDSVEAAHATYKGRYLGGFGLAEAYSLHASKLINGMEGGYVTTNHRDTAARLRMIRDQGQSETGSIEVLGLNAKLNEMHAAMALACLDILPEHIKENKDRHEVWQKHLARIPSLDPVLYDENEVCGYKNCLVRVGSEWPISRALTLAILRAENILATAYYNPPLDKVERVFSAVSSSLTHTEEITEEYILLPTGDFSSLEDVSRMGDLLEFMFHNERQINLDYLEIDNA